MELKRRVVTLVERIQELTSKHAPEKFAPPLPIAPTATTPSAVDLDNPLELEAGLQQADRVICRVACLSHDSYWRVQDHCARTSKPCVMVKQPAAPRIVSIQRSAQARTEAQALAQGEQPFL